MPKKCTRAPLLEALQYAERHIAAGYERIEKQQRVIERLEGHGDVVTAAAARVVLSTMKQGHIAERERVRRLLARKGYPDGPS